jgi:AraC-like DNA-binding protein
MSSNILPCQIPKINTLQPISKHTINLNIGCDVYYNSLAQHELCEIKRTHLPQHIDPHIKIAIPFEGAATQLSISDISYQLGFASQSHFTSTFRRFTSVTPKVYRKDIGASF